MSDSRRSLGDKTFSWKYDAMIRVTKETYPDENYLQYARDVGYHYDRHDTIILPQN